MGRHILGRIQITKRCNQQCVFCSTPMLLQEPSLPEIRKRISETKKAGTTDLMLTGGEPTERKDFLIILKFAVSQAFPEITIQTNAVNLDEKFLKKVKKLNYNIRFNVSFHAHDRETFGKITGRPEHFSRVVRNIKMIGEMGLWAYPTIVISSLNFRHLKGLIDFIIANFRYMNHLSFNYIDYVGRALENPWTVPRYSQAERYIHESADHMFQQHISFRLERVPLCYMSGFEHCSTDIRRDVFQEHRSMRFIDDKVFTEAKTILHQAPQCRACRLRSLCPGICSRYVDLHGDSEAYPVFHNSQDIICKMKRFR